MSKSTVNSWVKRLCPNQNHDISKSAEHCERCGAELCSLCGSDSHWTGEGHDLSNPAYWGI